MCLWVGQRMCKFSSLQSSGLLRNFRQDYCYYCLKGQQVVTLMNILNKLDGLLISQKK